MYTTTTVWIGIHNRVLLVKISNGNSNCRNILLWSNIFSNVKNLRPWDAPIFIFFGNSSGSDLPSIPLVSSNEKTRSHVHFSTGIQRVVSIFPNRKTSQMPDLFSLRRANKRNWSLDTKGLTTDSLSSLYELTSLSGPQLILVSKSLPTGDNHLLHRYLLIHYL